MTAARGIWLAVDVGSVRVGVARSDVDGVLAVPVETIRRDRRGPTDARERGDLRRLAELVREYEAVGVVVGLPRTLAGREGQAAELARSYGAALQELIAPVPVHFVDERLSTVSAQRKLHQIGIGERAGRAVIDQAAAVEVLQHWLDTRRAVPAEQDLVGHDDGQGTGPAQDGPLESEPPTSGPSQTGPSRGTGTGSAARPDGHRPANGAAG